MSTSPYTSEWMPGFADPKSVGRYEIIRRLGQGGTAVVYLGRDRYLKRYVAIKISHPTSDKARARFFVEAESAGRLDHQNIVFIYDAGVYEDFRHIIMLRGPPSKDSATRPVSCRLVKFWKSFSVCVTPSIMHIERESSIGTSSLPILCLTRRIFQK